MLLSIVASTGISKRGTTSTYEQRAGGDVGVVALESPPPPPSRPPARSCSAAGGGGDGGDGVKILKSHR